MFFNANVTGMCHGHGYLLTYFEKIVGSSFIYNPRDFREQQRGDPEFSVKIEEYPF